MCGFVDDECPEQREAPDIFLVVQIAGMDYVGGTDEPVERWEWRGFVVEVVDVGGRIAEDGHRDRLRS